MYHNLINQSDQFLKIKVEYKLKKDRTTNEETNKMYNCIPSPNTFSCPYETNYNKEI